MSEFNTDGRQVDPIFYFLFKTVSKVMDSCILWILLFFVSFHLSEAYGKVLYLFKCFVYRYILYIYVLNCWLKKIIVAINVGNVVIRSKNKEVKLKCKLLSYLYRFNVPKR